MPETILVVDDEDSVRKTFRDWLTEAKLDCNVLAAADAEEALRHAQATPIDLAVLDWNLGTGMDGLRLLEDLAVFCPDVVAILVTGYAHQATPLMALRMGVRDYLDKNHELTRESLVASVKKQLAKIVPAKRHRELHRTLTDFRAAVEQIVPLVQSSTAMTSGVPLPRAIAALCMFVQRVTGATDAVLMARRISESGEMVRAYAADGVPIEQEFAPFAKSLAATALSFAEPSIVSDLKAETQTGAVLQPFERGHFNGLIVPLAISGQISAALELFDKSGGFSDGDRQLATAASEVAVELIRQAIADRQERQTIFTAVDAALKATDQLKIPEAVRESIRTGLEQADSVMPSGAAMELAEAVQRLATRHGDAAVQHCLALITDLSRLLDEVTGA